MRLEPVGFDPFAPTSNVRAYVPRMATESALRALGTALDQQRLCALSGPPGIGKTLLLRLLAQRRRELERCVYVPNGTFDLQDLCLWTLGSLGEPAGDRPDRTLLRRAQALQAAGTPLLLLLDDAAEPTQAAARQLAERTREAAGLLRWVIVPLERAALRDLARELGDRLRVVELTAGMTFSECAAFLRRRLAAAGLPPGLLRRFDDHRLEDLARRSGGNPRNLQQLASQELQRELSAAAPRGLGDRLRRRRQSSAERKIPTPPSPVPVARPHPPVESPPAASWPGALGRALLVVATLPSALFLLTRLGVPSDPRHEPMPPPLGPPLSSPAPPAPPATTAAAAPEADAAEEPPAPTAKAAIGPPGPAGPGPAAARPAGPVAPSPQAAPGLPAVSAPPPRRAAQVRRSSSHPPPGPEPRARSARQAPIPVHINAVPWATVEMDGRRLGVTPLGNVAIVPGRHTFRVLFADGRQLERSLRVDSRHRHLSFAAEPRSPSAP